MGLREKLIGKPVAGSIIAGLMLVVAAILLARAYWPESKADLSRAYYTTDDGKTWFADSAYLVPPFDHRGQTAVIARVYSYADGSKSFCAYLAKFSPEAKVQLESAQAEAKQKGQPPGTVSLYSDPQFLRKGTLVKKPGAPDSAWLSQDDPKAVEVMSVRSPDGSALDEAFVH